MEIQSDYRRAIAGYIRAEAKPVEKYGHQPRLYALAVRIAAGEAYDDDVLYAAAWLHDLGVFTGHRPEDENELAKWDNVAYACRKAPEVLASFGFPPGKIPAVVESIRTHQPSGDPVSMEAIILRDADILEQLGAIGILRAVCKIGRDTRFLTFSDVLPVLKRALTQLPSQLRLPNSHRLAENKIRMLEQFLTAVQEESEEALF